MGQVTCPSSRGRQAALCHPALSLPVTSPPLSAGALGTTQRAASPSLLAGHLQQWCLLLHHRDSVRGTPAAPGRDSAWDAAGPGAIA